MKLPYENTFSILSCSNLDEILSLLSGSTNHRNLALSVEFQTGINRIGICIDSLSLNPDETVSFHGAYCSEDGRGSNSYDRAEGLIVVSDGDIDASQSEIRLILETIA